VKIPCPACAAKYSVADDKIQSRLAKIRCRKCGVTIVIDGTVDPVNVYVGEGGQKTSAALSLPGVAAPERSEAAPESGSPDSTGPGPNEYAVDIADNDQRNMTLDRIVAAYNSGVVTGETYIWKEGMADWQMLAEVPEVYNALHAAARVSGLPGGNNFGRSQPDPFARASGGDLGGQEQQVAGTGARNESSVLFSLSALTSGTVAGPTGGGSGNSATSKSKRSEDSGLIDLQALTAAAESPAPFSSPNPVAPFGGPALLSAPLGGVSSSTMNGAFGDYSTKRSSSKTGLIVGGVVLALAATVGTVVLFMQSGDASSPAGVAVSEEKAAAPRAEAPERKPAEEQAEPAAAAAAPEPEEEPAGTTKKPAAEAAAAEPEAEPAAPVRKVTHSTQSPAPVRKPAPAAAPAPRPAPPKPAPEPAAEAPKAAPPAAPAAPPVDKKKKACDCKPADLMCAMRCSAAK
jgi:predicted Zn finger-like uncharacterized protein